MKAKSWCGYHYDNARRNGDPTAPKRRYPRRELAPCLVEGCGRHGDGGRGWCSKHYRRYQRHGDPLATSRIVGDDRARFDSHIERMDDGCWRWTASLNEDGYGVFSIAGTPCSAHRWSYENSVGPIPDGAELDHLCHTNSTCQAAAECLHRRCVNPAHLEPVEHRVNVLRGTGFAAINAAKESCPQGHEYHAKADGKGRYCKTCLRESDAKRYRKSA